MNANAEIDVTRVIRLATIACALLAGAVTYVAYQPRVDTLVARLADVQAELRSDALIVAETQRLRATRASLERGYEDAFRGDAEAVFLRDLATATRRHGVTVVATSAGHADTRRRGPGDPFARTSLTVEVRGPYRRLLATVCDLSRGGRIVRVDAPSIRRVAGTLDASIPVTLFEPARANADATSAAAAP